MTYSTAPMLKCFIRKYAATASATAPRSNQSWKRSFFTRLPYLFDLDNVHNAVDVWRAIILKARLQSAGIWKRVQRAYARIPYEHGAWFPRRILARFLVANAQDGESWNTRGSRAWQRRNGYQIGQVAVNCEHRGDNEKRKSRDDVKAKYALHHSPLYACMLFLAMALCVPGARAQVDPRYGGLISTQGLCAPSNVALPSSHGAISAISNAGGITTATITSTAELSVGEAIFVGGVGVAGYNNAGSANPYIVATIPDGTHVTWAQAASLASSSGGSISRGQFVPRFVSNRWWMCTPASELTFINALYNAATYDSGTDYNGITSSSYVANRYASGVTSILKTSSVVARYYSTQRWLSWGFNAIGPYAFSRLYPTVPFGSDYGTPDQTIPLAGKMPFIILPRPAAASPNNGGGYASDNVKDFKGSVKLTSVPLGSGRDIAVDIDPFDPNFAVWFNGCLTTVGCNDAATFNTPQSVTGKYSDFLCCIMVDDADYTGSSKGGPAFRDWANGTNESYHGNNANDFALMTLIAAPLQAAKNLSGTLNITVVYQNTTFYAKIGPSGLINWLCGPNCAAVNPTTGVSASGNGSAATFNGSFNDGAGFPSYIVGELISIDSCSNSAFNTTPGTGVNVVSATLTGFTTNQAVSGSATGCRIFDGPNYGTIATLNSAWGSQYTQFSSTGTPQTQVTLTTSDHLTYTATLNTSVAPLGTQILNSSGTALSGADGGNGGTSSSGGPTGTSVTAIETFRGSGVSAGTLNDSTGAVSVTFSSSQAANEPLKTNAYVTCGWGCGTGVADEDGLMPSKGANAPWLPTDPWCDYKSNALCGSTALANTTNAFNIDRQNFLTHLSKQNHKTLKEGIQAVYPNVPYFTTTNLGSWGNPPRPGILLGAIAYADAITTGDVPTGIDTLAGDQARLDATVNPLSSLNLNVKDEPLIMWTATVTKEASPAISTTGSINNGSNQLTVASTAGFNCGMGILVGNSQQLQTHLVTSSCISGSVLTLASNAGSTFTNVTVTSAGDTQTYFDGFNSNGGSNRQTTEGASGTFYANKMSRYLTLSSTKFGHPHVIGAVNWQFQDQRPENQTWTMETPRGNAYDGVQACYNTGTDAFGFPTGGEIQIAGGPGSCYGNFIGPATTANAQWQSFIPTNGSPVPTAPCSVCFIGRK
jgi:hypothetical protein